MHKIDLLQELFQCNICNGLLHDPVILPCGETICCEHLTNLFDHQANKMICQFCSDEHSLPHHQHSFPKDKRLNKLIELKFNEINLGKILPKFNECKQTLTEMNEILNKIELVKSDPETFIYNYFNKIINKIDLHREKLKLEIDAYSEVIIKSIKHIQDAHTPVDEKIRLLFMELDANIEDINKMVADFNSFDINADKIEQISAKADKLKPVFNKKIKQYENTLLKSKSYEFIPSILAIDIIFGKLSEVSD